MDAKHNLEYVQQRLKEQQENETPEPSGQEEQDDRESEKPQPQTPGDEEDRQQEQSPAGGPESQEEQVQKVPKPAMSKEEAERLLNALEHGERKARREQARKRMKAREVDPAIDW